MCKFDPLTSLFDQVNERDYEDKSVNKNLL